MEHAPIRIVTVSRQFGSGGSDLAHALGRLVGWRVVDRQVVADVARTLQVTEQEVDARDESAPRLGDRLGKLLAGAFPELVPVAPDLDSADYDAVAALSEAAVRSACAEPPVIVVGHGGMCLLDGHPGVLNVRVCAPFAHRVAEVARRTGVSEAEAREEVEMRDEARRAYIRVRFGRDWEDPDLYALTVNSRRLDPETGARMLAALLNPV